MRRLNRATVRVRGGVLLSMLVFAGIIAMFLAGVATLAVSHFNRAEVEGTHAAAIQLADAGVNYELRWVSEDTTDPNRPHQAFPATGQPGPYTGTVTGAPGTFTVKMMNIDGTGPWRAPNEALIESTGTINGISRTIQIRAKGRSIFDEYVLYSTNNTTINGSGSTVVGNFGTNGGVNVNGGNASDHFQGDVTFNGTNPSFNGSNVYGTGQSIQWPTVDEIANLAFPSGGLAWLRNNNSNGNLKKFAPSDSTYEIANAVNANIVMNNYEIRNQTLSSLTVDNHADDATGGSRYANQYEGLQGRKVLIFPPGDYYFERISHTNVSTIGWLVDNAAGRVRIWVGAGNNQNDSLDLPVVFTSQDPAKFRLYYNKCRELSIMGNSTFYGGIYAVVAGCQSTVQIGGNSTLNGTLIGNNIILSGNSSVIFPNNGGSSSDDFALWFGFQNNWKEINPNGGPVFVDGRSN